MVAGSRATKKESIWSPRARDTMRSSPAAAKPSGIQPPHQVPATVPDRAGPGSLARTTNMTDGPAMGGGSFQKPVLAADKIGVEAASWPNYSNAPPLADKPHPQRQPEPTPNTNYRWDTTSLNSISELENHTVDLRQRRQQTAHESQYVWHWLAEQGGGILSCQNL